MIYKNQVGDAAVVAQQISARGYRLEAQVGTPLRVLTDQYVVSQSDLGAVTPGQPVNVQAILKSANGMDAHENGIISLQDEKLEKLSDDIAAEVVRLLAYVRFGAAAMTIRIVDRYMADAAKHSFAPSDHEIVVMTSPEDAMDVQVMDQIEKYAAMPAAAVRRVPMDCSLDYVKNAIIEAYPGCDWLHQWFAKTGDALLNSLHGSLFGREAERSFTPEGLFMGDNGFDASLYAFLACMALHNEPPEGVKLTLAQYNDLIYNLRARAALRLKLLVEQYTSLVDTKTIYYSYTTERIVVVKPVYEEYIAGGGTASQLSTIVRMPSPLRTLDEVATNRDKIEAEHRRQVAMALATMTNTKTKVLRDILMHCTLQEFAADFEKVYPDAPKDMPNRETWPNYKKAISLIEQHINNAPAAELEDPYVVCSNVVAKCIYFHADVVEKILFAMNEAKRVNPQLTPDECALMATYTYVFDFVMDQIDVVKV